MKKMAKRARGAYSLEALRAALGKRTRNELADLVIELVSRNFALQRKLELRFGVEVPDNEIVSQTRQAIADATDFDEGEINYNFDYDRDAYKTVERNFARMIRAGQLDRAMQLSLELMREGSYQVEMSDEGLMSDDIETCLETVLRAVEHSSLPPAKIVAWCTDLQKNDRVGFILHDRLDAAKNRFQQGVKSSSKKTAPVRRKSRKSHS